MKKQIFLNLLITSALVLALVSCSNDNTNIVPSKILPTENLESTPNTIPTKDKEEKDDTESTESLSKVLKEISLTGGKISFTSWDDFSIGNLKVTAFYSDGTLNDVTKDSIIDSNDFKKGMPGVYTIKVSFSGKEASYSVVVKPKVISDLEINTDLVKKDYLVGEEFSIDGLKAFAIYKENMDTYHKEPLSLTDLDVFIYDSSNNLVTTKLSKPGCHRICLKYQNLIKEFEINVSVPDIIFTAAVTLNGNAFKPKDDEEIFVIWENGSTVYKEKLTSNGTASIKNLEGDFVVRLSASPEGYIYDPNLKEYIVNSNNPNCEIKLNKISRPIHNGGDSLYNSNVIVNEGYYRCSISNSSDIIYYEFRPNVSGVYEIESLVDCRANLVNPTANIHIGTQFWKPEEPSLVNDDGGYEVPDGFTKNFKFSFSVSDNMIGNGITFGIKALSKLDKYPLDIDFKISKASECIDINPIVGEIMEAKELNKAKITLDTKNKRLVNADGGTGNYFETSTKRNSSLNSCGFKYKEDVGIYYYYDFKNSRYIAPLCCYITTPNPYFASDGALAYLQLNGNKALTVRDSNNNYYDYSKFIESQYASIVNNDGLVYVTRELKDFLVMFSKTQRLFMDGNGFIESQYKVEASEENQWLFACCYYIKLA